MENQQKKIALTNQAQNLTDEISKLKKLATDNLSIGNSLLEKKLVDNIEGYLENNRRISNKIEEYKQELILIKQQLVELELIAQIEN